MTSKYHRDLFATFVVGSKELAVSDLAFDLSKLTLAFKPVDLHAFAEHVLCHEPPISEFKLKIPTALNPLFSEGCEHEDTMVLGCKDFLLELSYVGGHVYGRACVIGTTMELYKLQESHQGVSDRTD